MTGGPAIAGRKEGPFHAEWHDANALRVSVIELDELGGLDVTTREDGVSAIKDGLFFDGAVGRFTLEVIGLHQLERVKRHHERQFAFVF